MNVVLKRAWLGLKANGVNRQWYSHSSKQSAITFIGAGNMSEALLGGLDAKGYNNLRYVEVLKDRLEYMQKQYPAVKGSTADDQHQVLKDAHVIILSVKPQHVQQVMPTIRASCFSNDASPPPLIISIVGGVTIQQIMKWMKPPSALPPIIRCMPNTPALLGEGAFGMFANAAVSQQQRHLTDQIMHAVAKEILWLEQESMLDTITGISGSGPAYFFLLMEAMQKAGVEAGMTEEDAKRLTVQTCLGAARMAQSSEDDLAMLRRKVTSPNGATEAAIQSMEAGDVRKMMKDAVFASSRRARELSRELD